MNTAATHRNESFPQELAGPILIVDDDHDFADSLADSLELQGYQVKTAYDAPAAIAAVERCNVQVALLDIRLEQDNGIDLIPRFYAARPDLLCVMVTANADLGSAVESLRGGAYDFLKKPLHIEELTAVLDRCFQFSQLHNEKTAAEAARHVSEARFRAIFDHAGLGIALVRPDGGIEDANRQFCDIIGRSGGELSAMVFPDLVFSDDREDETARMQMLIDGTVDRVQSETRLVRRDSAAIRANVTMSAVRNATAQLTGCVLVIEDVTARRESEERLHHAQRMEAIGQLTGGIAHDFNNLLTVVLGNLDMARDDLDRENPVYQQVSNAAEAAQRGAALVDRLLSYSRKQVLRPRIADVNPLVSGMVELLRGALGETIDVQIVAGDEIAKIRVDPSQLESAVLNLAINARDAMSGGGRIVIETANVVLEHGFDDTGEEISAGPYVAVSVSDNGTGMTAVTREKAFQPFYTTKEVGKGTGLGLSMVYGFARQSGGHARIASVPGDGTVITIYLPAAF